MTRVLLAGGGTAGHVFPAVAVARALVALDPSIQPIFAGTSDRLEDRLVPAAGFALHHVPALPLPRRLSLGLFQVPAGLRAAVRRCEQLLRDEDARVVITFGGYVGFPVARAAARLGIPLIVHEQNAVPGLANRFAGRWASKVAVTFPGSADHFAHPGTVVVTGNPVREEILALDLDARRPAARQSFGLAPDVPTLLVFGGSQGARTLNRAVVDATRHWAAPKQLQVLHAAGDALHAEASQAWAHVQHGSAGPLARCVDFIEDMGDAYAAADVVVCRAGATTVAELTALGRPAMLVPYPHATRDHQMANARAIERIGGARTIEDGALTGATLVAAVEPWLTDPALRAAAARAARVFGRRDAAVQVARLVLHAVQAESHPTGERR